MHFVIKETDTYPRSYKKWRLRFDLRKSCSRAPNILLLPGNDGRWSLYT